MAGILPRVPAGRPRAALRPVPCYGLSELPAGAGNPPGSIRLQQRLLRRRPEFVPPAGHHWFLRQQMAGGLAQGGVKAEVFAHGRVNCQLHRAMVRLRQRLAFLVGQRIVGGGQAGDLGPAPSPTSGASECVPARLWKIGDTMESCLT